MVNRHRGWAELPRRDKGVSVAERTRIVSRRFGCVLAVAFIVSVAGPALAESRPHPCDQPPTRPVAELRPLAEAGDPDAQYRLGLKYEVGNSFENTWSEAASWFRRAAKQGHLMANLKLGIMTLQGRGVQKDSAEGLRLLRLAAGRGNLCAQGFLGRMLMTGVYVPQDFDEAAKWFGMAAEREFYSPQRYLAEMYSGRIESLTDLVESLHWAIIAEKFNPYESDPDLIGKLRDEILPKMSSEQIAEAERRAQAWLARHGK